MNISQHEYALCAPLLMYFAQHQWATPIKGLGRGSQLSSRNSGHSHVRISRPNEIIHIITIVIMHCGLACVDVGRYPVLLNVLACHVLDILWRRT